LPSLIRNPIHIFSERPNRIVEIELPFTAPPPRRAVAKLFKPPTGLYRIGRRFVRSRPRRAFDAAVILGKSGVGTPVPYLLLEDPAALDLLLTEPIHGGVTLRRFLKNPPDPVRPVLAALAATIHRLHESGLFHRDLTQGNILLRFKNQTVELFLVDLSRAVAMNRVPLLLRLMDLSRLNLQAHWPDFLRQYTTHRPLSAGARATLQALIRLRRLRVGLRSHLRRFFQAGPAPGHGSPGGSDADPPAEGRPS
jgi:hypothetical protein